MKEINYMNTQIIIESLKPIDVPFIVHKHNPRSGSSHFDIRFVDNKNPKLLHSFAAPSNFLETKDKKIVLAKTRDHDIRWLTLKSYRLDVIDKGQVTINISTNKYFELVFHGKVLNGKYKLFKMHNTSREDRWLLVKSK